MRRCLLLISVKYYTTFLTWDTHSAVLLKLHMKLAPGWALIQVNFDPIQEIGLKVGGGRPMFPDHRKRQMQERPGIRATNVQSINVIYSSTTFNPHLHTPSGLPTPQNLRVVHSTNSSVKLLWDLPPPPQEVITEFKVCICCTPGL